MNPSVSCYVMIRCIILGPELWGLSWVEQALYVPPSAPKALSARSLVAALKSPYAPDGTEAEW